jgi:putative FmdB family regulatory protein
MASGGAAVMPTYEYACKSCDQHLEVVQSFTADSLTTCPACGGSLRKVFGNIGISFKGSGFYRNDSRAASNGSGGSKGKERTGSGAGKESAGSGAGDSGGSGTSGSSSESSSSSGSGSGGSDSSGSSSGSGSSGGRPASAAAS